MFERSRLPIVCYSRPKTIGCVIVVASVIVVELMSAAIARDDSGMREFWLQSGVSTASSDAPPRTDVSELRGTLTISGPISSHRSKVAIRKVARQPKLATRRVPVKSPDMLFGSNPGVPTVVSMYEDRTLRRGDAVMTTRGLRLFAGSHTFPFRPEDFTTLGASRSIKGELRRALMELDQLPLLRG